MSPAEFIAKVKASQPQLAALVDNYHPRSSTFVPAEEQYSTAPGAQMAANRMCAVLQKKDAQKKAPQVEFAEAVEAGNVGCIYGLLAATWCGVPEVRSWRSIEGAKECSDLLDDPPEMAGTLRPCPECGDARKLTDEVCSECGAAIKGQL